MRITCQTVSSLPGGLPRVYATPTLVASVANWMNIPAESREKCQTLADTSSIASAGSRCQKVEALPDVSLNPRPPTAYESWSARCGVGCRLWLSCQGIVHKRSQDKRVCGAYHTL
jgi:hypothetical protein